MEDKPPPAGCERGKLKEKNMMQKDEHDSYFFTLFQQDEFAATSEVRLENGKNSHTPIISEEVQESPSI